MALEHVNQNAYDILFDTMKPYILEVSKKGKRKERNRLRSIMSMIYSSLAETMTSGTLAKNEVVRRNFVLYLQETCQYLSQPEYEFIWDSLQFLRYHFCIIVRCVGQELQFVPDLLDKGLRKELFQLLSKWSRGEEILKEEHTKKKIGTILAQMKDQERLSYEKMINEQTAVLQHAACLGISTILLGPCWDNSTTDPNSSTFNWINALLQKNEKLRRIGRSALQAFFQGNVDNPDFLNVVVNQCYSSNINVAKGYFFALVELFKEKDFQYPLSVFLNLVTFKAGDKTVSVRKHAIELLQLITAQETRYSDSLSSLENVLNTSGTPASGVHATFSLGDEEYRYEHPLSLDSVLQDTYQQSQFVLASKLAVHFAKLSYSILHDAVIRIDVINDGSQKQMLSCLISWIDKMDFRDSINMYTVFEDLMIITYKYADEYPTHVQAIWTTVSSKSYNISPLIKFLLEIGVKKQNPNFVPLAKRITMHIGRTSPQVTIDSLVAELSSLGAGAGDAKEPNKKDPSLDDNALPRFSQLIGSMQHVAWQVGRGHLSLILLAELSYEIGEEFRPHLPAILQLVFLAFDSLQQPVYEHSRVLLLNLIHSLVIDQTRTSDEDYDNSGKYHEAIELEDYLKSKEGRPLWPNEDINIVNPNVPSASDLAMVVRKTLNALSKDDSLREKWANEALSWAVSCPSPHLITRSYQIYRALNPPIGRDAVIDVLRALGKCMANETEPDNAGITLEILYTLQVMVEGLELQKLILFTQFFWAVVAVLHTDYEQHFSAAMNLLSQFLKRVDFNDKSIQNVFRGSIPQWEPSFIGVQPLVLKGLLSPITEPSTIKVLSQLTPLPCSDVFHPHPSRLVANVVGLLPYLCIHLQETNKSHDCFAIAQTISETCDREGHSKLAKVFSRYATSSYDGVTSFLTDAKKPLRDIISPKHNLFVLTLLFTLLEDGPLLYEQTLLLIIYHLLSVMADTCLDNVGFRNKIPQWFKLVTKFLSGSLYADALNVLTVGLKPTESATVADVFVPNPGKTSQGEFPNQPLLGTAVAAKSLEKILETCSYNAHGSINHDISPTFWNKFFSGDFSRTNSQTLRMSQAHLSMMTPVPEEDKEDDDQGHLSYLDNLMEVDQPESQGSFSAIIENEPNKDAAESSKEKFRFEGAASQFGRFLSFRGFEDILDFGDFEAQDDED
eukprot:TRINITY_DN4773_c0_g1_i3.p1 TRINITY_DN4773_c0_g1~~TRINITY_DN4773_c0_g1_i3.p1  ORF type:complete len:1182 (-),score=328.56 TRINITY_DN4773_c0_g1_i3:44-3589(-)